MRSRAGDGYFTRTGSVIVFGSGPLSTAAELSTSKARPIWFPAESSRTSSASNSYAPARQGSFGVYDHPPGGSIEEYGDYAGIPGGLRTTGFGGMVTVLAGIFRRVFDRPFFSLKRCAS